MSRSTRTLLCLTALLVSVAALPLTSRAGTVTIYSNLNSDPSNVYTKGSGWGAGAGVVSAMGFAPGANYDLSQIDVAMGWISGTNSFTLKLVNDNGNQPGTTVLESWTISGSPIFVSCCSLETVTSTGVLLLGGNQYWLEAAAPASVYGGWKSNSIGTTGREAQSLDGGSTWSTNAAATNGAFDVLGSSPVPEPGAAMLLGTALASMLVLFHCGSRRPS